MKAAEYPPGTRLLVSWYIRDDRAPDSYCAGGIPMPPWKLNGDTVAEVHLLEWSPSGQHVRLKGRLDEPTGWAGVDGWYPIHRIHIVEVLTP